MEATATRAKCTRGRRSTPSAESRRACRRRRARWWCVAWEAPLVCAQLRKSADNGPEVATRRLARSTAFTSYPSHPTTPSLQTAYTVRSSSSTAGAAPSDDGPAPSDDGPAPPLVDELQSPPQSAGPSCDRARECRRSGAASRPGRRRPSSTSPASPTCPMSGNCGPAVAPASAASSNKQLHTLRSVPHDAARHARTAQPGHHRVSGPLFPSSPRQRSHPRPPNPPCRERWRAGGNSIESS